MVKLQKGLARRTIVVLTFFELDFKNHTYLSILVKKIQKQVILFGRKQYDVIQKLAYQAFFYINTVVVLVDLLTNVSILVT